MAFGQNVAGLAGGLLEQEEANRQMEELRKLGIGPKFSEQDYESAQYAGDFNPAMLDTPEAASYQTIEEDPRLQQLQMDSLQALIDRTSGAADARMQSQQFAAMDEANQLARGREQAIAQDAQRRGQGGSGFDAIMRAQAAQIGANRARAGNQDAVEAAALEKLAAQNAQMQGYGNLRDQAYRTKAANSQIVNDFNRFNTQARNAARAANVNAQNEAGMRNTNARQGQANAHATTRNESLNRKDRIAQAGHTAQMDRFGMENAIGANRARGTAQAIQSGAGMAQDVMTSAFAGMNGGGAGKAAKPNGTMMAGTQGDGGVKIEDEWEYA